MGFQVTVVVFLFRNLMKQSLVSGSSEQRIWAAAGFMTQFIGSPCRLQVLESSSTLLAVTSLDPELAEPYMQTTNNA